MWYCTTLAPSISNYPSTSRQETETTKKGIRVKHWADLKTPEVRAVKGKGRWKEYDNTSSENGVEAETPPPGFKHIVYFADTKPFGEMSRIYMCMQKRFVFVYSLAHLPEVTTYRNARERY